MVIPVRDEAANVAALAAELADALAGYGPSWEAVWIDDGSRDGTRACLETLEAPQRWIGFTRGRGQSAALIAGFRQARGTWIATLDGDGQNDPADLPRLHALAIAEGFDLVTGYRAQRRDGAWRQACSRLANTCRDRLTGDRLRDAGCATRVMRRSAVADLPSFHGLMCFLPSLVRHRGLRVAEVPVTHRPRRAGRSKYGTLDRVAPGLRDCLAVRRMLGAMAPVSGDHAGPRPTSIGDLVRTKPVR